MNDGTDELLMRFLDGELHGAEEERALRAIAADPEARRLLRFDARLRRVMRMEGHPAGAFVPEGFTDRVMRAIEAREAASEGAPGTREAGEAASRGAAVAGRIGQVGRALNRPRTLVWRPIHALAAAALVALVAGATALALLVPSPTAGPGGSGAPLAAVEASADTVLVRFTFEDPSAGSVAVAGDFSRWDPVSLSPSWRDGRRIWSGVVAVPRGEHRYMFVVDGARWVTDPLATTVRDDGFGGRNAILSL